MGSQKKYIKAKNVCNCKTNWNSSWGLKGVLRSRELELKSILQLIGNGKKTSFWLDPCYHVGD